MLEFKIHLFFVIIRKLLLKCKCHMVMTEPSERDNQFWSLEFGIFLLFEYWNLEFIWYLVLVIWFFAIKGTKLITKELRASEKRQDAVSKGKYRRSYDHGFCSTQVLKKHDCRTAWPSPENQAYIPSRGRRRQQDVYPISCKMPKGSQIIHWNSIRT